MATVTLKGLTKRYGDNTVVDRVDLDVPDGTLLSILGPSGCGKTTLLRMIAGFVEPNEGDVLFDGESVASVPPNKRNIGMVFQSYALFPHMTVRGNVAYGLEQRKLDKKQIDERVDQVLATVRMEEFRDRKPGQLSGGQQQRVALARALAISPRLLLLDESLSALDKKLRVDMQVELRRILEETRITTLFVTHDQEEAMTLSDQVVVMNEGRIEQSGAPAEVYEKPKNAFVASFLGKANFFEYPDGSPFAVRPEKIHISSSSANPKCEGVLSYVIYAGNMTTYGVEVRGRTIVCEVQNTDVRELLAKGQKVFLAWEPASEIRLEG